MTPITASLDARIAPIVELLRAHEVDTFASCEGGAGHAFDAPTVRVAAAPPQMRPLRQKVAGILSDAGYSGDYIKEMHAYQSGAEPWAARGQSFLEIEFWSPASDLGEQG